MALFKLTTTDGRISLLVRGKCLSCARNLAADAAGTEGPATWLDGNRSTIEVLRPDDRSGVLMRTMNEDEP